MPQKKNTKLPLRFWVIPVYFSTLIILLFSSKWLMTILVLHLIFSLITLGIYAWDKSAAVNNRWRTPESTLHILSLIGGWPGAMLAQQFFRHKTQKQPFRFLFWLTVMFNISIVLFTFQKRFNLAELFQ